MAEVETKAEVIESNENEFSGDESKENEEKSTENTPKSTRTPLKTLPLFDSPLTQSGKRVRSQTPQFAIEQKEEFKYEFNGSGVALGQIAFTEHHLNKELADTLKKLHSVCFGRPGDRNNVKKNLRQFNGLPFDKSDTKYEVKKTNMERFSKQDLNTMCKILGLQVSGMKTEVIVRILDFLLKPVDQDRKVPKKKKKGSKKKSDKGKKRARKSKGGNDENDSTAKENDTTADDTADTADSSSESGSESESETEEKPKKTPAKKPEKTPAKKVAKKTPAKKTPAKKTPAKAPAKKTPAKRSNDTVDSDSDSSDDEPLIKKTKTAPTNDEIKKKVENILEGANLEEVTMKSVCKQVYELYPGFDLTDRKNFIKETVKSVLGQ